MLAVVCCCLLLFYFRRPPSGGILLLPLASTELLPAEPPSLHLSFRGPSAGLLQGVMPLTLDEEAPSGTAQVKVPAMMVWALFSVTLRTVLILNDLRCQAGRRLRWGSPPFFSCAERPARAQVRQWPPTSALRPGRAIPRELGAGGRGGGGVRRRGRGAVKSSIYAGLG